MTRFGRRRGGGTGRGSWNRRWRVIAIIAAVLLFAGLLVVDIAGHAFKQQPFTSPSFNYTPTGFPTGILGGSLMATPSCDPTTIRPGDVFRTNHSMFAYKVVDTGQTGIEYQNSLLSNCWVEEIIVRNTKDLDLSLPPDFGFFPKAECLVVCESPSVKLWTPYTYTNADPLRKVQAGMFPSADIVNVPPSYWAQAVLTYWWDQLSVNLTQANEANFNSTLGSVLLQAIYPNATGTTNDFTTALITTSFSQSNSSQPTIITKQAFEAFTPPHLALLNRLRIFDASNEFMKSFFWAVSLDLGQFSENNIFTNSDLLANATDIFHNNSFINNFFQNTPLSDGKIPGDGFRQIKEKSKPLSQTSATLSTTYLCWKWVRKPLLLGLIDVAVPTLVLLVFISLPIYFLVARLISRRKLTDSRVPFIHPGTELSAMNNSPSFVSMQNPEQDRFLVPRVSVTRTGDGSPHEDDDQRDSLDSQSVYAPTVEPSPFKDTPPSGSGTTIARAENAEVRTLESDPSIMETPIENVGLPAPAGSFDTRVQRLEQQEWLQEAEREQVRGTWTRRLSERRSSTDLKRTKVLK